MAKNREIIKECKSLDEFIGAIKSKSGTDLAEFYVEISIDYKGQDPARAAARDPSHRYDAKYEFVERETPSSELIVVHPIRNILLESKDEMKEWINENLAYIASKLDHNIRTERKDSRLKVYSARADLRKKFGIE